MPERSLPSVRLTWRDGRDLLYITAGTLLQALALRLFLIPSNLVVGGVGGIAQLVNHYTGWPIGVMILLGNLPLFALGWRYLGGLRFVLRTAYAVVAVSFFTDFLVLFLPAQGLTGDIVLNTLYGGLVSGVGYGLVYRGRGTSGGSDILARVLYHWRQISLTASYLWADSLVILLAGLVFGWQNALYAMVVLYVSGIAAEWTSEGSDVLRTALIITACPDQVKDHILHEMERGVTLLPARGGYTGAERTVLFCVVSRPEVAQIKDVVRAADPAAFMVIGQAHQALGEGFQPWSEG
jgi:uncharacterized membrane-anchored protein YitT (DUF2179 family)